MKNIQSVFTVDAHTAGTPIRVITSGIPPLKGSTVEEKMEYMKNRHDWLRLLTMTEPRGFPSLVGAVLTESSDPGADYGLFYIDALTYQPMCGAGTFSVAKVLVETGMVAKTEPETVIRLDTPSGIVTVRVEIKQGDVRNISFENVPAFLYQRDVKLAIPEFGQFQVDIVFGGNFFTVVDVDTINLVISKENMGELRRLSRIILDAANRAVKVRHPVNSSINYMDQLLFVKNSPSENEEYLCQCIFGDAQADISPCGTGTSARLAQRFFRGLTGKDEVFRQKSVYGGVFTASIVKETTLGNMRAITPKISCNDVYITGFNHLVAEEGDQFNTGSAI